MLEKRIILSKPLKWMERLVIWYIEVDLKIYSKLSKRQYGFTKDASTDTNNTNVHTNRKSHPDLLTLKGPSTTLHLVPLKEISARMDYVDDQVEIRTLENLLTYTKDRNP